jgi:hypothetical protein
MPCGGGLEPRYSDTRMPPAPEVRPEHRLRWWAPWRRHEIRQEFSNAESASLTKNQVGPSRLRGLNTQAVLGAEKRGDWADTKLCGSSPRGHVGEMGYTVAEHMHGLSLWFQVDAAEAGRISPSARKIHVSQVASPHVPIMNQTRHSKSSNLSSLLSAIAAFCLALGWSSIAPPAGLGTGVGRP